MNRTFVVFSTLLTAFFVHQGLEAAVINYGVGLNQLFTVPAGVQAVQIEVWGAQGRSNAVGTPGGSGGYASGNLAVFSGEVLRINAGSGGSHSTGGGSNSGGNAGNSNCGSCRGGGGGGATDVRQGGTGLNHRVIVAGGGGGAGGARRQGQGPGSGGGGGAGYYGGGGGGGYAGSGGGGGTQTAGGIGGSTVGILAGGQPGKPGSLGPGGAGGFAPTNNQAGSDSGRLGGSGGGLVGQTGGNAGSGAHGSFSLSGGGGGGGSSYIGGVTNGSTSSFAQSGHGAASITYNLPVLLANPSSLSILDFGKIDINDMITLASAVSLSNTGGFGSFIDLSGFIINDGGAPSAFSITSGDASDRLEDGDTSEIFSLKFNAAGLAAGDYTSTLTFGTTEGDVVYALKGSVIQPQPAAMAAPEPTTLALMGLALAGLGFQRRKSA